MYLYNITEHNLSDTAEFSSKNDGRLSKNDGSPSQNDGEIYCRYCKCSISHANNLRRHERTCKDRKVYETELQLQKEREKRLREEQSKILLENQLKKRQHELEMQLKKKDNELEELKEVKDDYMELLKQIALSKTKAGKSINMFYIINNFDKAYNYEDLMKPALTDAEKNELDKLEPLSGSIFVIENRCITDMDVKKRPIHCLDTARDKYLLRTKDSWVVDHKAKKIFSKVSSHIYKHYLLDPQDPSNSLDKILKNQQQLIKMEGKTSQIKLMKELNDKVYIKNIKLSKN